MTLVGRNKEGLIPFIEKKAGVKFERTGAPQPADMAKVAGETTLHAATTVCACVCMRACACDIWHAACTDRLYKAVALYTLCAMSYNFLSTCICFYK